MKKYQYTYQTSITFDCKVYDHHFKLRCLPYRCGFQTIEEEDFSVSPCKNLMRSRDGFGNELIYGSTCEPHKSFTFASRGIVLLSQHLVIEEPNDIFRLPTLLTETNEEMIKFSDGIVSFENNIVKDTLSLVNALHERMKYESCSTTIKTSAIEAFTQGKGVCQDFSHVILAILRSKGIACRYISGFIPGEGESHAWIEVNDNGIWYAIDPTRSLLIESDYLKIAQGRDFNDCTMERGVFVGSGEQHKLVHITMAEI
ncbi:MAG: transglutaminase family protein [Bacteroidales bacterium]|nr:transglutaminase family protein [Bacteroidales bacterium]